MGLQTYEYGLKPQDGFEVITHFEFTSQHLDILNRLFTPLTLSFYESIHR